CPCTHWTTRCWENTHLPFTQVPGRALSRIRRYTCCSFTCRYAATSRVLRSLSDMHFHVPLDNSGHDTIREDAWLMFRQPSHPMSDPPFFTAPLSASLQKVRALSGLCRRGSARTANRSGP